MESCVHPLLATQARLGEEKLPRFFFKRRVGRKRQDWLVETLQAAFELLQNDSNAVYDPFDISMYNNILDAAALRIKPFQTKPSNTQTTAFSKPNSLLG